MITNNFEIFKKALLTSNQIFSGSGYQIITVPTMKNTAGENTTLIRYYRGTEYNNSAADNMFTLNARDSATYTESASGSGDNSVNGVSIWLGKSVVGDEETQNDYKLADAFSTSDISSTQFTCTRTVNDNKIILNYSRTFKNISNANIEIKEVGFLRYIIDSTNNANYRCFLFDRRILPEAITLAPNAEYAFTMGYEF